jgi:hypothetical protein
MAPYFICLLSSLVAPNLHRVTFESFCFWDIHDIHKQALLWSEVDRILGSQAYSSLCSVKISLPFSNTDQSQLRQMLVEYFPLLVSRGVLNVRVQQPD